MSNKFKALYNPDYDRYLDQLTVKDLELISTLISQYGIKNANEINTEVIANIEKLSIDDPKTILRWGMGHFYVKNDMNEMLDVKKTLVISTVYDLVEMYRLAQEIEEGRLQDPPDYIYMPERKREDSQVVPEKVISVAEYLEAQEKEEISPKPQKPNGRGY